VRTVSTVRYWSAVGALGRHRDIGHIAYVINDDLHARAKALAAYQGRTFKAWLERAIADAVERQEAERAESERKRRSR
jgi:hypothetical protein